LRSANSAPKQSLEQRFESVFGGFGPSSPSARIEKRTHRQRRMDMQMSLSDDEAVLLARVVKEYFSSLREEIYKTDTFEVKNDLKREESILKGILEKLA
jgi:hypothetical protein